MVVESPPPGDPPPSGRSRLQVREAHGAVLSAGISAGDVIVALNDVPLDGLARYASELAGIRPDAYVAVLVMRQGRFQHFALAP